MSRLQRRQFLVLAGALVAQPLARAQPIDRTARIGFLVPFTRLGIESRLRAFRTGLLEFGYQEGRNLVIEFRSPEGRIDLLPVLAKELVALNVDVLVTGGSTATQALSRATKSIPIVMTNVGDAVAMGLIASLARPGGNVTGSTYFIQDLYAKRLELLREALPHISRVAVLLDSANVAIVTNIKKMEAAAASMKIVLHRFEVRRPEDFEAAFDAMTKKGFQAITVVESPLLAANVRATAGLATKHRLPSSGSVDFGEAGGMIGYGIDGRDLYRRAAYFVDRILKGAKPADLPVEQPTRFETVINMKTARALQLAVPQSVLVRAARVIE